MIFRTLFDALAEKDEFRSCPGTKEVDTFAYNEDGDLVVTGKHDLHSDIQSHALSVDINYLMTKFQSGDISAFDHNIRNDGMYGDFTDMPESLSDVRDRIEEGSSFFDSLSDEIKAKFDNDPFKFWSDPNVVRYFNGNFGMVDIDSDNSDRSSSPASAEDVKDGEHNE